MSGILNRDEWLAACADLAKVYEQGWIEETKRMTPREKIHAAIDAIAQEHGYTVHDILGKSRLKHLVSVRRRCILMLREQGYSTTEIGRLMDRDHSTIVHALNKVVDTCNELV